MSPPSSLANTLRHEELGLDSDDARAIHRFTSDPSPHSSRYSPDPESSQKPLCPPKTHHAPSPCPPSRRLSVLDFDIIRVLGKGCAGKVLMVKLRRPSASVPGRVYAMKTIKKNHVLAHRELHHTLTEQSVLRRVADEPDSNPFIVRLWSSFHDKDHLFLVMDFHPGGDLATQLARWGRLGRDRARFYAAEIAEGVTSLHDSGVIYRDLKPENILIAFDGHIVLTDFGLSKQFPPSRPDLPASRDDQKTWTFCGTAEYLAPEVLLGEPYSYEVDWWSFGTMLYEMLTGLTPFWSEDHATMYRRVLHDELTFGEDSAKVLDHDTKTLLRGLLQRNPLVRMTGERIKKHPYFGMIDWDHVRHKRYIPPYVPSVNPDDATDTQNFDETFLAMEPTYVQEDEPLPSQGGSNHGEQPQPLDQGVAGEGEKSEEPKVEPQNPYDENGRDVFDGYSYLAPRDERDSFVEEDPAEDLDEGGLAAAGQTEQQEKALHSGQQPPIQCHVEEVDDGALNTTWNSDEVCSTATSTRPTSVEKDPASASDDRHNPVDGQLLVTKPPSGEPSPSAAGIAVGSSGDEPAEDDWDVVAAPEEGAWDINGHSRGRTNRKKANNTLFARGVVDKYRLRMRKVNNEGSTVGSSNVTLPVTMCEASKPLQGSGEACGPPTSPRAGGSTITRSSTTDTTPLAMGRASSVDDHREDISSSAISGPLSPCSENGSLVMMDEVTQERPNGKLTKQPLKRFGLRKKKCLSQSADGGGAGGDDGGGGRWGGVGLLLLPSSSSKLIGAQFFKNRTLSNFGVRASSSDRQQGRQGGGGAGEGSWKKNKLKFNGLLSQSMNIHPKQPPQQPQPQPQPQRSATGGSQC